MAQSEPAERVLLVFDFDHTLVDDNVDTSVCRLAPGGDIPQEIRALYKDECWIDFMGAVFRHLHQHGVSAKQIQEHVENLPLVPGMDQLFDYVRQHSFYETIVISDANTVLIQYLLRFRKLDSLVSRVFTNPAEYDSEGCLLIRNYHTQDWCLLSTINLCKGRILQDYIRSRGKEGVTFKRVFYVGDGSNDLCPGLTLRSQDYLLPRKGYSLWKKLETMRQNKSESKENVVASVLGWDSATEIKVLLERIAVG